MAVAFVYPGQGSQAVGMGRDLYDNFKAAKDVLDAASLALKMDLKSLMFDGSANELSLTENTQPALLCASLMAQKVLGAELGLPIEKSAAAAAGHSLGEYSALAATGCLTLEDAVSLVRLRGLAMRDAVPLGEGAMAAILGLGLAVVEEILSDLPNPEWVAEIANDNSPGQVVVSGHVPAIEFVMARAKEKGAKRAVILPVSAPFHGSLMLPAAATMEEALAKVNLKAPKIPVYANVTARAYANVDEIKRSLVLQVTGRVRWVETIRNMFAAGIDAFVEVGPGKVLAGLIKRVEPNAKVYNFGHMDDLKSIESMKVAA